jgi:hypothetical protein
MKKCIVLGLVILTSFSELFSQDGYGLSEFQNYNYIKTFSKTEAIILGENGQVGKWNGKRWNYKQHSTIVNFYTQRGWFLDTNYGFVIANNNPLPNALNDSSYIFAFENDRFKFTGFKKSGQIISIDFFNKNLGAILLIDSVQRGSLFWYKNGAWTKDAQFSCNILPPYLSDYNPKNLLKFTENGELYVLTNKQLFYWDKSTWSNIIAIQGGHDIEFNNGKGYILRNNNVGNSTLHYFNGTQWAQIKSINNAFKICPFNFNDIWLIHCNSHTWSGNSTSNLIAHYKGSIVQNQFKGLFPEQTNWISMYDSANGWICGNNATLIKIEKGIPINYTHRPSTKILRDIKMGDFKNGISVGDSGTICIKKNGNWLLFNSLKNKQTSMYYTCHFTDTSEFLVAGKNGVFLFYKNGKVVTNTDLSFVNNMASFRSIQKMNGKYLLTSFDGLFEFNGVSIIKLFGGSCYHSTISKDNTYFLDGQIKNQDGSSANGFSYLQNKEFVPISGALEYYYMYNSNSGKAWAGGRTFQLKPVIGWQEIPNGNYHHELVGDNGTIVLTTDGLNGFYIRNSQALFFVNNVQQIFNSNYVGLYNPRFNADKYNARKVYSASLSDSITAFVCGTDGLIFTYRKPEFKNASTTKLEKLSQRRSIQIFPNPAANYLKVSKHSAQIELFQILDCNGYKVMEGYLTDTVNEIPLKGLSKGVYYFILTTEHTKFIKD